MGNRGLVFIQVFKFLDERIWLEQLETIISTLVPASILPGDRTRSTAAVIGRTWWAEQPLPPYICTVWVIVVYIYIHTHTLLSSSSCLHHHHHHYHHHLAIKTLLFQRIFRFAAKLRRRYRDFPYTPYRHTRIASRIINISHQSGTFSFYQGWTNTDTS